MHAVAPAVHTQGVQLAVPFDATQVSRGAHAVVRSRALPLLAQIATPDPLQRALPGTQQSGWQAPASQKLEGGQSVSVAHTAQ